MSLTKMPNELLYMVVDHLHLRDQSALILVNRHFTTVLQPYLRSRLRTLSLQDVKYALLAIHWSVVSNNHDQLKFLLENTTNIRVIDGARRNCFVHINCFLHISPGVCDGDNWEKIRACRHRLRLRGPLGLVGRVWDGRWGRTAVEHAISIAHHGLLRIALAQETDHANAMDTLRFAAAHGSLKSFKVVLSAFRATFGKPAWELAQQKSLELVVQARGIRFFFQDGDSISSRDSAGRTLLHRAVVGLLNPSDELTGSLSHPEVVRLLLWKGANVNARDNCGRTALHDAAAAAFKDVVELLLQGGALVGALDNEGCSPVHMALRAEQKPERWAVVAMLQEFGADFGIADRKGVVARDLIDGPRELRSSVRRSAQ